MRNYKTGVCANCGADIGLHHFGSYQCPKNGREPYDFNAQQDWQDTFFEDSGEKQLNEAAPELLTALQELVKEVKSNYDAGCATADWYNNNTHGVGQTLDYQSRPAKPQALELAEKALGKALGKEDSHV